MKMKKVCKNCKYIRDEWYQMASMHYVPVFICGHKKSDGIIKNPDSDTCEKFEPMP